MRKHKLGCLSAGGGVVAVQSHCLLRRGGKKHCRLTVSPVLCQEYANMYREWQKAMRRVIEGNGSISRECVSGVSAHWAAFTSSKSIVDGNRG